MYRKDSAKKEQFAKVLSLIQMLESDEQSLEFRQPVDYIGLQLHDYPAIVKKPMDIGTVKVIFLN